MSVLDQSGVYAIKNIRNGMFYIGSTENFRKRKNCHLSALRRGKHINRHLQRAFLLYGETAFLFSLIEVCAVADLQATEQKWLDEHFSSGLLYNHFQSAYSVSGPLHPMFGHTHDEAARQKIKEARKRQVVHHSPETRAKMAAAGKKRPVNMQHIQKMLAGRRGKPAWNKGLVADPSYATPKIKLSLDLVARLVEEYGKGVSVNALSRKYGVTWEIVRRHLRQSGITTRGISEQKFLTDARKRLAA